jgi:hypothetical protein
MSDQIGVLGSATTATTGTTTAYTVPSGKAAKVKLMWAGEAHAANSTGDLTITVNGLAVATILNMTAANFIFSSTVQLNEGVQAAAADGITPANTVAPAPAEYYLSAADTVTYTIATDDMVSMNMQVVGTEIDV